MSQKKPLLPRIARHCPPLPIPDPFGDALRRLYKVGIGQLLPGLQGAYREHTATNRRALGALAAFDRVDSDGVRSAWPRLTGPNPAKEGTRLMGRPRTVRPAKNSVLADILEAYLKTGGDMVALAKATGVSRNTLYRWYSEGEPKNLRQMRVVLAMIAAHTGQPIKWQWILTPPVAFPPGKGGRTGRDGKDGKGTDGLARQQPAGAEPETLRP